MRKILYSLAGLVLLSFLTISKPGFALAQTTEPDSAPAITETEQQPVVNLYFFYGEGCPHCSKEKEFLQELKAEYQDEIKITAFEVYYSPANSRLMETIGKEIGKRVFGVPLLFVEDNVIDGFKSAEITGAKIENEVKNCLQTNCQSQVDEVVAESGLSGSEIKAKEVIDTQEDQPQNNSDSKHQLLEEDFNFNVPLIGQVDLETLSLPVLTVLLGGMDGFNPCAMWILIFLITMLINLEDKRRLYILGFSFIFVSALVYFAFLAAWFNLFQFIGFIYWIRLLVGTVAIGSGIYHLKEYYEKETGCKVTNSEQRSRLMTRMKEVISRENLWLAVAGISALAVSVNLIELVCSAGLPAIYTNILALSDLTTVQYYSYLILYTLVFMFDDLFIFTIAVKTFEVTGITNKYSKMSSLVGGIVILILGVLLLFRPQMLMFG